MNDMKLVARLLALLLTAAMGLQAAPSRTRPVIHIPALLFAAEPASADGPALQRVGTFELPKAVIGPFDHFGVDLKNSRLFSAAEAYHAVLVLDLYSGKVTHEITGLVRPHAIVYTPDTNRIYITDGGDGSLKIYDGTTYQLEKRIGLDKDADSIGYDPLRKLLYVVNGGKDVGQTFSLLSVIDTDTDRKMAEIHLDGDTLEAMALDTFRPRLYINDPAKSQIDVLDRWTNKLIATWPVTMGKRNVAMALDETHQRLFTGCRSGQIVVFDSNTGRELQAIPITTGVDDLAYDAASGRIYAAGNGKVDVIREADADHYESLGEFDAGGSARNARLVQEIDRYFVAVPQTDSSNAAVAVFKPEGIPTPKPPESEVRDPIDAPFAERLVLSMLSSHPDLRKLGLHAVPPGQSASVIIANGNSSRVGYKSSAGDLDAVKDGKTYCVPKQNGSFYNMKLPLHDASGRTIGILVMEIPFTSATTQEQAVRQSEEIRAELATKIPDYQSLFQK
jgi:DNA-binding beta-propeller fold protein YncE